MKKISFGVGERTFIPMKPLILIGAGGAIGSMCRYLMTLLVGRYITVVFPMGTFLVNLTGCFLIGLLFGFGTRYGWLSMEWRLFLVTGICGGYTTFSSFSYESITLFREQHYTSFFLYALGSLVLGLLATVGGLALAPPPVK
jgi:fluoride exporter